MMTDIERLIQLSSVLQHYRESVQRWEDSKRADESREYLHAAQQRGILSSVQQDAERDRQIAEYDAQDAEEKSRKIDPRKLYLSPDDECRIAREAVQRCQAALEQWVPLLNEFFDKAITLDIEYKTPSLMKIRASGLMPHKIDGFDWDQFAIELAETGDRAMRAARSAKELPPLTVTLVQMSRLLGNKPTVSTMRNHAIKNPLPPPVHAGKGVAGEYVYAELAAWVRSESWQETPIIPDEEDARRQLLRLA
ncbi:MAG: hypothetical protein U0941_29855 [Planctomycetaceae bacterium]